MVRCTRRKGAIWQRQRQQDGVKKKKGTRSYYECADKFTWVHIHVSTDLNPITPKWNSMLETQLSNLSLKTENKATKIEGKEERSKIWNEGELRTWTESELKKGLATLSVINKQKHCKQKKTWTTKIHLWICGEKIWRKWTEFIEIQGFSKTSFDH